MTKISDIVGKAIISAETGEDLGKVADVLLDPASSQAVGLVISGGISAQKPFCRSATFNTWQRCGRSPNWCR